MTTRTRARLRALLRLAGAFTALLAAPGHPVPGVPAAGALRARPPLPQSAPDTIRVWIDQDGARVEQRIPDAAGTVEAYAIRIGGRGLDVESVTREGERLLDAVLEPLPGAYRFRVRSGAPVRVRYRVRGAAERVPLFVPAGPGEVTVARGPALGVVVRVHLPPEVAARLDPGVSLPRLRRSEEAPGAPGTRGGPGPRSEVVLVGHASAPPSFLHLRRSGRVPRLADAASVLLILLGALWAWRKGRRRGPDRASEPGRSRGSPPTCSRGRPGPGS